MRDVDICRKLFFIAIKDERNKDLTIAQIKEKLLAFFDAKIVEEAIYTHVTYTLSPNTITPAMYPLPSNTNPLHSYTKSSTN